MERKASPRTAGLRSRINDAATTATGAGGYPNYRMAIEGALG